MLSDDVLLEIFDLYQRNYRPDNIFYESSDAWYWQKDWHILAHVCQRWRQVVFASPLRLNLQILCTYGTPVRKNLYIWPTLPIAIGYLHSITKGIDEDNLIAALELPDRVSAIGLHQVTGPQLRKVITVMQEPFSALENLELHTGDKPNDVPVLPPKFLGGSAPRLQTIDLYDIPFPALPTLLLSTTDLVTLYLFNIPQTRYIPPEAMVVALDTLTRLEVLHIGFQSPASRPDQIHVMMPPTTRTVLPALNVFEFRGVREYLEVFVARIDAPLLNSIAINYFNQLADFEVPQLWQFIDHSGDLNRPMRCLVEFQADHVTLCASPAIHIPESESFEFFPRCMNVNIRCEGIDWQVSRISQAINQISAVLSNVAHVDIGFSSISAESEDTDDIEWLQLLRPFPSAQTLIVSGSFAGHVSHTLEASVIPGVVTEVLPVLEMLCLEGQHVSSVHKFIAARSESNHPVTTVGTRVAFEERLMSYQNDQ